jgi:hypothetical protein
MVAWSEDLIYSRLAEPINSVKSHNVESAEKRRLDLAETFEFPNIRVANFAHLAS